MAEPTPEQVAAFKRGWEAEDDRQVRALAAGPFMPQPGARTAAGLRAVLGDGVLLSPRQAGWAADWHDHVVDQGGEVPAHETGLAVLLRAVEYGQPHRGDGSVVLSAEQARVVAGCLGLLTGGQVSHAMMTDEDAALLGSALGLLVPDGSQWR